MTRIDLRNCDIKDLMADLDDGSVHFVHADPPWRYEQHGVRGNARDQYEGLPEDRIAYHLVHACYTATDDAYMVVWCTWPKLSDWFRYGDPMMRINEANPWVYLSGGAWGKLGENPYAPSGRGVGHHFAGDSELLLLYKKAHGKPKPRCGCAVSNLWNTPRTAHSAKPQAALLALLELATNEGDTVLDLYAGESASMALACRSSGRNYIGAEIDPERHARAMEKLKQGSLF